MSKSNSSQHCIILVPGLGDRIFRHTFLTQQWKKDNVEVVIHTAPWNKKEETFDTKLQRLLNQIDQLAKPNIKLSLIGTSAGGSLVINAYAQRKNKIHKVINVCGRVRKGKNVFPSLEMAAREYTAFYKSVIACEHELTHLTHQDQQKIMTVSPWPFDGIVPLSCIPIAGASNITVPIPFHMFGIGAALTFSRKPLMEFIKQV